VSSANRILVTAFADQAVAIGALRAGIRDFVPNSGTLGARPLVPRGRRNPRETRHRVRHR
jgi:hypothetical protein